MVWGVNLPHSLVAVQQEAFQNEDVGVQGVCLDSDPVGTGKLLGVAHPGLHGVQHGLHVQGLQHWGQGEWVLAEPAELAESGKRGTV